MEPIVEVRSKTVVLPTEDIDTDQIIPARFLTTTSKNGLGKSLFADWRFDAQGKPRADFVLNTPAAQGAAVLVAGRNFGCGSSREHAPWALLDFGIRAVVSTEIADIFRNNSLKNGLVPIIVGEQDHRWLIEHPGIELTVDLQSRSLLLPDGRRIAFPIDGFSRYCLLHGLDQLGFLLENEPEIRAFEQARA
jgi:3-isopropylmalate/(R)-2-methylmalate dehydratase small subunit